MKRAEFDEYLRRFNARDYDGVLDFYGDAPEIVFAGYRLSGRQAVKDFYAFFHSYVNETIEVTRFVADDHTLAMEATVRLEGLRDLTPEILAEKGLERLVGPKKSQVIEIPQFIHYHIENGKFTCAHCAVFEAPRD